MKFRVVQEYTAVDSQIIEADNEKEALELSITDDYCNSWVNENIYEVEYNVYEVKD